jgi:hypothetical protein
MKRTAISNAESIEWYMDGQAFSLSYSSLFSLTPYPPPPTSVSSTGDKQADWERENLLTGDRGEGWSRSQIIRPQESLVLYILSNTLIEYRPTSAHKRAALKIGFSQLLKRSHRSKQKLWIFSTKRQPKSVETMSGHSKTSFNSQGRTDSNIHLVTLSI